jgi:hypothetical protein
MTITRSPIHFVTAALVMVAATGQPADAQCVTLLGDLFRLGPRPQGGQRRAA